MLLLRLQSKLKRPPMKPRQPLCRNLSSLLVLSAYFLGANACTRPGIEGIRIGNLRITSDETLLAGQILKSFQHNYEHEDTYIAEDITIDLTTGCITKGAPPGRVITLPLHEESLPAVDDYGLEMSNASKAILWWCPLLGSNHNDTIVEMELNLNTNNLVEEPTPFFVDEELKRAYIFYWTYEGCHTAIIDLDNEAVVVDQPQPWEDCLVFPDASLIGYDPKSQVAVFAEFCLQDRTYFFVNETSIEYLWKSDGRGTKTHLLNAVALAETPEDSSAYVIDHELEHCNYSSPDHHQCQNRIRGYTLKKIMIGSGELVSSIALDPDDDGMCSQTGSFYPTDDDTSSQTLYFRQVTRIGIMLRFLTTLVLF